MKKLLLFSFLLIFISCGDDEPEKIGPITCAAHYSDDWGSRTIFASYYLFEGTGFTSFNRESFLSSYQDPWIATRLDGTSVKNIGWTTSNETRGKITPVYWNEKSFNAIQAGTFTIICNAGYGIYSCRKVKTFTKKKDETIMLDAYFVPSDFDSELKIIPW